MAVSHLDLCLFTAVELWIQWDRNWEDLEMSLNLLSKTVKEPWQTADTLKNEIQTDII